MNGLAPGGTPELVFRGAGLSVAPSSVVWSETACVRPWLTFPPSQLDSSQLGSYFPLGKLGLVML